MAQLGLPAAVVKACMHEGCVYCGSGPHMARWHPKVPPSQGGGRCLMLGQQGSASLCFFMFYWGAPQFFPGSTTTIAIYRLGEASYYGTGYSTTTLLLLPGPSLTLVVHCLESAEIISSARRKRSLSQGVAGYGVCQPDKLLARRPLWCFAACNRNDKICRSCICYCCVALQQIVSAASVAVLGFEADSNCVSAKLERGPVLGKALVPKTRPWHTGFVRGTARPGIYMKVELNNGCCTCFCQARHHLMPSLPRLSVSRCAAIKFLLCFMMRRLASAVSFSLALHLRDPCRCHGFRRSHTVEIFQTSLCHVPSAPQPLHTWQCCIEAASEHL